MASALECWSSRASTEEEAIEQAVLMQTHQRSESESAAECRSEMENGSGSSAFLQKRFHKFSRNVSEAIASLKNSLSLDPAREPADGPPTCRRRVWGGVVRSLTQLYPGSQLPEKLVTNLRKHYDSMPLSYANAGFEMKDVFLHMKLIEQASAGENPATMIQELSEDSEFKLTFACNTAVSWPTMSSTLETSSICCKNLQIFEKKSLTLGTVVLQIQTGQERTLKTCVENALKLATKRPKNSTSIKLPFGLCGCQEEGTKRRDFESIYEENNNTEFSGRNEENSLPGLRLKTPLPRDSIFVSVDEWQTIVSGRDGLGKWLLPSEALEIGDQTGPSTFKGAYRGKRVTIEKLKGCDKGNTYEFVVRRDLLELMTCGHRNLLPFHGVCLHEGHGLCVVAKLTDGGSLHELVRKSKKIPMKEVLRIAIDVAEGIKFVNDHGISYMGLNARRVLLDKRGNACLGDMGIVSACNSVGEAMDYETDGFRWLAPEIIAGDLENPTETRMSNAYSLGMIIWEMMTGQVAYSAYSPVQAAVGIAACGLRPEIPESCPPALRALMVKCWNQNPSKRPQFSEILSILSRLGGTNVGPVR